jgi:hypothetical protein
MSSLKMNRIGLATTAALVFAIAAVQGCSSSDNQAGPSGGTGGVVTGGGTGGKSSTGGSSSGGKGGAPAGGTTSAGTGGASGEGATPEGGAAGETGNPGTCQPAEDHGEAAYLAAHGNKLPTL